MYATLPQKYLKCRTVPSFLKKLCDGFRYGYKQKKDFRPRPYNTKQRIKSIVNRESRGYFRYPKKAAFESHNARDLSIYFNASSRDLGLLEVDIDCHGVGDTASCQKALAKLQEFAGWDDGVFDCDSPGGVNAFLVGNIGGEPEEWQKVAKRFNRAVKLLFDQELGRDVSEVALVGLPCSWEWANKPGKLENIRCGQWGKLPRWQGKEDLQKLKSMRVVTLLEMEDLCDRLEKLEFPKKPSMPKKRRVTGSVLGLPFTPEQLEENREEMQVVAHNIFVKENLYGRKDGYSTLKVLNQGKSVTFEQVRDLLMILAVLPENENGAMPTERIRRVWQVCYRDGLLDSSFDSSRFKVIRDLLSRHGMIEWQCKFYKPGFVDADGEKVNGFACKWSLRIESSQMSSVCVISIRAYLKVEFLDKAGVIVPTLVWERKIAIPLDDPYLFWDNMQVAA